MASVIKVRTISSQQEVAIQVANSCFARKLSIPAGWQTVRVGLRLHMDNTGAGLSTPQFGFGLCSGSVNIFGDASVGHFLGAVSSGPWSFQTTFYNNTSFQPAKKVGSTLTAGTTFTQNAAVQSGAASNTADRALLFVDITKQFPTPSLYTLNLFYLANTSGVDVSAATFLQVMEEVTPSLASHGYSSGQTIAVDESVDGTFDSINVSWNRTTPFIEICDIAFARLA